MIRVVVRSLKLGTRSRRKHKIRRIWVSLWRQARKSMSSSTSAQTRDLSENSRDEANKALTNCEYLATGFDLVVFDAGTPVETREYFMPFYPRAGLLELASEKQRSLRWRIESLSLCATCTRDGECSAMSSRRTSFCR